MYAKLCTESKGLNPLLKSKRSRKTSRAVVVNQTWSTPETPLVENAFKKLARFSFQHFVYILFIFCPYLFLSDTLKVLSTITKRDF